MNCDLTEAKGESISPAASTNHNTALTVSLMPQQSSAGSPGQVTVGEPDQVQLREDEHTASRKIVCVLPSNNAVVN